MTQYSDYGRNKEVRRMCLAETANNQRIRKMPSERFRGLGRIRRVFRCIGYWSVLVRQSAGHDGGAVVPPCVFQSSDTKYPLNKGSPNDFSSRDACGQAHAPLPTHERYRKSFLQIVSQMKFNKIAAEHGEF